MQKLLFCDRANKIPQKPDAGCRKTSQKRKCQLRNARGNRQAVQRRCRARTALFFRIFSRLGCVGVCVSRRSVATPLVSRHAHVPLPNRKNHVGLSENVFPNDHVEIIFVLLTPSEMPEALDRICKEYNCAIENMEVELPIAISTLIYDFPNIHPYG